MRRVDAVGAIRWVDVNDDGGELAAVGLGRREALDRLHVIEPSGTVRTGAAGFLALWSRLPYYRRLVPVVRRVPGALAALETAYRVFARHRLALTGRRGEADPDRVRDGGG